MPPPPNLLVALGQMVHGLIVVDADGAIAYATDRVARMWGVSPCEVAPGTPFTTMAAIAGATERPADAPDDPAENARRRDWELAGGRVIQVTASDLTEGGWIGLCEDVTEQRSQSSRAERLARRDPLTGLADRAWFGEELQRHLAQAGDREVAVLVLDLDHFKSVNDTLGHPQGDLLLTKVAARMRDAVRTGDVVARLGGDEFAVIQVGAPQPAGATNLARRLIEAIVEPFDLNGHRVDTATSVGIAIAPWDATTADDILKHADLALYRAKGDGRGAFRLFEPEMSRAMNARRDLELDLRRALLDSELELHYQPLVTIESGRVSGFEALLRWNHPERGAVSPAEFIPVAEESGLIVDLGRWVLRRACRDASRWPVPVPVSVNVSPAQFGGRTLTRDVLEALAEWDLPPHRLELEITETVMISDTDYTLRVLTDLKSRGVRISMDDFGTGYSSLSYLRKFPFDKIKIDRSFIRDIDSGGDGAAIIRAVTGLGQSMGMVTTAEGVETDAQLAAVRREGCGEMQGYLVSRPQPASEVPRLLGVELREPV